MRPLDDLLSSAGRVPEITEDALKSGRHALNAAIAEASAQQAPAGRKAAARWWGSWRGITVIGATAAVAAAAVVAGAVVLPSSSTPSKTAPQAATAAKATVKPWPKASVNAGTPVTIGSVSYSFDTTTSDTPVATVLDAAATAIGSEAGAASEPNVDWGGAPYYHMVSVGTCGSGTYTNNTWTSRNGNGVGLTIDSKSGSDSGCEGAGGGARSRSSPASPTSTGSGTSP